ncbi:MAG TPA: hypothetical protein VF156_15550 [Agromyces sp.]
MTSQPTSPAQPVPGQQYPTDTTFAEPNPAKRPKVTPTLVKDIASQTGNARKRIGTLVERLAEVGIVPGGEESNPIRAQLVQVVGKLHEAGPLLDEAEAAASQAAAVFEGI